jgi:predicted Rossmann-fold nucleotide-binding protein
MQMILIHYNTSTYVFVAIPNEKNISIPSIKQHCTIDRIAIFGSADVDAEHPLYKETFAIARHFAYLGKIVVDGGGPTMAAATLGAQSAEETIAVTLTTDMPEFEGQYGTNLI